MKVFASDYDGTLRINGVVSKNNLDALKVWKEKGNKFGLVTGRSVESALDEVKRYGFDLDFLVCNNGGVIYDKEMHLLKLFTMDFDKAKALIDEIRQMDCNSFVLNNGVARAKENVNSSYEDYKYGHYSSEYSVERLIEEKVIAQIVISINDDALGSKIADYINTKYDGYLSAFPNVNCVDIVPYGVDKRAGLAYVCEHYGYADDDVYVCGDAFNDLPMLTAYQGASLYHAYDEVKKQVPVIVKEVADYLAMLEK